MRAWNHDWNPSEGRGDVLAPTLINNAKSAILMSDKNRIVYLQIERSFWFAIARLSAKMLQFDERAWGMLSCNGRCNSFQGLARTGAVETNHDGALVIRKNYNQPPTIFVASTKQMLKFRNRFKVTHAPSEISLDASSFFLLMMSARKMLIRKPDLRCTIIWIFTQVSSFLPSLRNQ